MSKNIAHVIKHANFQLYRAYSTRVIWKNWQLKANEYTKEFDVLCIKRGVSPT